MPNLSKWFLPADTDVLGMLREQARVTVGGMDALAAWGAGEVAAADRIRAAEHAADEHKRALRLALRAAFITPIGAEDMYVLSERLDAVLNGAKDAVRESEVMALPPDEAVEKMTSLLAEAVRQLAAAFERLGKHGRVVEGEEATDSADAAVKSQRQVERVYRRAMSDLLAVQDLREVMGRRELYRRLSRIGETIVEVAERVWYASVKEA
jgi:hypothetical protein